MIPVIFINCSDRAYVDSIMTGTKKYETRTRNTLKALLSWALGERILIAETGHGAPVVRCSAVIDNVTEVFTEDAWLPYIMDADIANGGKYDWQPDTKKKVLYHLTDVHPVTPFVPTGRRHGRVWMECDNFHPDTCTVSTNAITKETDFAGRSGQSILIHRYGQDDYSVWMTDNPNDETSGCSVRGTMLDIIEEVADEVPARKIMDNTDRLETIGCFIDIFEDFLEAKGISIPNDEKDADPDAAIIYGTDYGELSDSIEGLLINLGVLKNEAPNRPALSF